MKLKIVIVRIEEYLTVISIYQRHHYTPNNLDSILKATLKSGVMIFMLSVFHFISLRLSLSFSPSVSLSLSHSLEERTCTGHESARPNISE